MKITLRYTCRYCISDTQVCCWPVPSRLLRCWDQGNSCTWDTGYVRLHGLYYIHIHHFHIRKSFTIEYAMHLGYITFIHYFHIYTSFTGEYDMRLMLLLFTWAILNIYIIFIFTNHLQVSIYLHFFEGMYIHLNF